MIALLAGAGATVVVLMAAGSAPRVHRHPEPSPQLGRSWATVLRRCSAAAVDRARPQLRRQRRDAQLPDALERLASALRGGLAIAPALRALADAAPEPLADDLRPVAAALERGAPTVIALAAWADQPGASEEVRLVVASLTLGAEAGGEVARAVDRTAATLRERHEVQGEVRALATQARASAAVLVVAPVAFAGLVSTIEPGAIAFLLASPLGLVCLLLGLGLDGLGAAWMARITRSAS